LSLSVHLPASFPWDCGKKRKRKEQKQLVQKAFYSLTKSSTTGTISLSFE